MVSSALSSGGSRRTGAPAGAGLPSHAAAERPIFAAEPDALLQWERDSAAADALGLFQTAAWSKLAAAYDLASGRRPVLLTDPEPRAAKFALPLSVAREGPIRVARIVGEPLSEYSGVVGSGATAAGLERALAGLRRQHGVDLVVLRRVPRHGALDEALDQLGARVALESGSPVFHLGPKGLLANAAGGLPRAYRDARRRRRRLQAEGGYRFEVLRAGPRAEEAARLALAWKKEWVRERSLLSRLGSDRALEAAIAALYGAEETGAALGLLHCAGEPVAVEGGFLFRDRFFAYTSAYRLDRRADGVGKVAVAEMVEWCAANGVAFYDKGAPADPYKLEWTDRAVPVADRLISLTRRGWALGEAIELGLKPLVKRGFNGLPPILRGGLLRLTRYDPRAGS